MQLFRHSHYLLCIQHVKVAKSRVMRDRLGIIRLLSTVITDTVEHKLRIRFITQDSGSIKFLTAQANENSRVIVCEYSGRQYALDRYS